MFQSKSLHWERQEHHLKPILCIVVLIRAEGTDFSSDIFWSDGNTHTRTRLFAGDIFCVKTLSVIFKHLVAVKPIVTREFKKWKCTHGKSEVNVWNKIDPGRRDRLVTQLSALVCRGKLNDNEKQQCITTLNHLIELLYTGKFHTSWAQKVKWFGEFYRVGQKSDEHLMKINMQFFAIVLEACQYSVLGDYGHKFLEILRRPQHCIGSARHDPLSVTGGRYFILSNRPIPFNVLVLFIPNSEKPCDNQYIEHSNPIATKHVKTKGW